MPFQLNPDRYFSVNSAQRELASNLYNQVKNLPIVSPHGHVDPKLFSNPAATFGTPADLFIIPDHYVFRMLYSQGIQLEDLGVPRIDGGPIETDHRKIWQAFAENYYLFRGTPSGGWIDHSLYENLGISQRLNGQTAQAIYDEISEKLASEEFKPRNLMNSLNIEVMCTTDAAADTLSEHQAMRADGFGDNICPTFRPDAVVNLQTEGWLNNIQTLSEVSGINVTDYQTFIQALEQRRGFFKEMGAHATDHAAFTAYTQELSSKEANDLFQRAMKGQASAQDAMRFTGHMLIEMARMSIEDGLVMQVHVGSFRNHSQALFERHGRDKGADIPISSEFTQNIRPLLNKFGSNPNLDMILFVLDEDTYSRELSTLAGVYPSIKVGPPWWFHDSPNGMRRYFDTILETAGIYNTAGFNDDTRAFLSIPARHDVWRRVSCDWLAGMVLKGRIAEDDAPEIAKDFAYNLTKKAYHFD